MLIVIVNGMRYAGVGNSARVRRAGIRRANVHASTNVRAGAQRRAHASRGIWHHLSRARRRVPQTRAMRLRLCRASRGAKRCRRGLSASADRPGHRDRSGQLCGERRPPALGPRPGAATARPGHPVSPTRLVAGRGRGRLRHQNVRTAQVWPERPPPTVLCTPALVGGGTLVVHVSAPAIWLPEIVVPPRLALAVTAPLV